mmetsp:Transcript_2723/g.3876  ORF Transcript_2723/g.3876 Transcript_2723/m.3876 type:complete len:200 (-) Transcript_2723:231-830(-)
MQNPSSVPLTPSECWRQLSVGIASIFRQWTVVRLAVENNWGGGDSQRKLELMLEQLLPLFQKPKPPFQEDVEDYLEDFLDAQFHTVAEDGSLSEVASIILEMFQKCGVQDMSLVNNVLAREQQLLPSQQLGQKVADENDDDSDEDMNVGSNAQPTAQLATIVENNMEEVQKGGEAMVDADGWETVSKPRRSARLRNKQK